jgi:hypothetical protein
MTALKQHFPVHNAIDHNAIHPNTSESWMAVEVTTHRFGKVEVNLASPVPDQWNMWVEPIQNNGCTVTVIGSFTPEDAIQKFIQRIT